LSRNDDYEPALNILTDLIKKYQEEEVSSVRTSILAQHDEWKNKWFEAVKLREKAFEQS
jgi:hypothetical protein